MSNVSEAWKTQSAGGGNNKKIMGTSRVILRRPAGSQKRQAQLQGRTSRSRWIEKLGDLDATSLCVLAAILVSSFQNFRVSLSGNDGFTIMKLREFVTGTMEVAMCAPSIFVLVHESALAPWKSWMTCRPNVRIFRDTTIFVVISYLILLDINLSFVWLAIFPVIAIVFIGALYLKFSCPTPGSSNIAEKTNWKTREIKIILLVTFGALLVMDELPDHAAEGFPISQFLLFLSSTVAALTRMLTKLPVGASLPGVARASEMLHKTLLLLLLLTVHTVAAELLGEDVVLLCLLEVIPVFLWFIIHHDSKPGIVAKMKPYGRSLVFLCAVVAPLIAYLAITKDEFGVSTSFLMLTYYTGCSLAAMLNWCTI